MDYRQNVRLTVHSREQIAKMVVELIRLHSCYGYRFGMDIQAKNRTVFFITGFSPLVALNCASFLNHSLPHGQRSGRSLHDD